MTSLARTERAALCELFLSVGPDAPTLCEGWSTVDLAVHLAIRDRRPDALAGLMVPPLAGHTAKVEDGYKRLPWARLVAIVRSGPPAWSPIALTQLDEAINTIEFFVHHEDVRRAAEGWEPRELPAEQEERLWRRLRAFSRMLLRKSPVGVALRRPDGVIWQARPGSSYVTLTGAVGDLVLYAFGRKDHARVEVQGDDAAVASFTSTPLGF